MFSKIVIVLFSFGLILYVAMGLVLFFFQGKLLYYPSKYDFEKCKAFADAERLNLDGTRAYFKRNSDTLVVFYHGNASSACWMTYVKKLVEEAGHSYLFVEYAGYSDDGKNPSKKLLFGDAENAAKFAREQKFQKVFLMSESLGGAIAAHHADVGNYDAMLLISPFDSLASVAQGVFAFYPTKLLLRENYDNIKKLKDKDNVWILHGTNDMIVPDSHSKKLFQSMQGQGNKYLEVPEAGHNDIYLFKKTTEVINNFLNQ